MRGKLHCGVLVLALLLGPRTRALAAPAGCAFLADASVRVGNGSAIDGDLAANRAGATVHLGRHVELADDTTVAADTVELLSGTSVFDVAGNMLEQSRGVTIRGTVSTATLPLVTPFCETTPVACGGPGVRVGKNGGRLLTPGAYGQILVENGGTLTLAAGTYTLCGLRTGRNATIAIGSGAPTTIAVAGDLVLENGSTLLSDAGAPPAEIVVAGERLKIGAGAEVEAFIVAGPARATVGRGAVIGGAICARTLSTSRNVSLHCATVAPSTTTTTSTSTTTMPPTCGNGELDAGEECDPGSPGGAFLLCDAHACTPGCTCEPPPTTSSTSTTVTTTTVPTTSTSTAPSTSSTSTLATTSSTTTTVATDSTTTTTAATSSSTTSTSAAPPTTVLPTTTTTITFPLDCGNGNTNAGETCDDGNDSDNDACPSDCRIDACTALTTQRFVSVRFAPPEGGLVAGLTMLLDYPEGSVDLPGNATTFPSGTISGVPPGAFVSVNDLNFGGKGHAARITVGAGAALPPGQVVRLRFNDCQGATVPPASAFPCAVLTASDPFLNAVNGVTCSVVVEEP
jgi:cysteine-rich repeat protein